MDEMGVPQRLKDDRMGRLGRVGERSVLTHHRIDASGAV
nr:hypothetical protein asmbl_14 [uncultured bacterium]